MSSGEPPSKKKRIAPMQFVPAQVVPATAAENTETNAPAQVIPAVVEAQPSHPAFAKANEVKDDGEGYRIQAAPAHFTDAEKTAFEYQQLMRMYFADENLTKHLPGTDKTQMQQIQHARMTFRENMLALGETDMVNKIAALEQEIDRFDTMYRQMAAHKTGQTVLSDEEFATLEQQLAQQQTRIGVLVDELMQLHEEIGSKLATKAIQSVQASVREQESIMNAMYDNRRSLKKIFESALPRGANLTPEQRNDLELIEKQIHVLNEQKEEMMALMGNIKNVYEQKVKDITSDVQTLKNRAAYNKVSDFTNFNKDALYAHTMNVMGMNTRRGGRRRRWRGAISRRYRRGAPRKTTRRQSLRRCRTKRRGNKRRRCSRRR